SSSGFAYGLSVADRFVVSGESRNALVIGAETLSRLSGSQVGAEGPATLFADGAGAVFIEPAESVGLIGCRLGSNTSSDGIAADQVLQIPCIADLDVSLNDMRNAVVSILTEQGLKTGDIDWLIPHQSSFEIIERTADSLGISRDKTVLTLAEQGNTGAASVPIALDIAVEDGRIKRGDLLLLETIGGGFTWGSALVRF
ncbi:MAG: 3-oxoacyl-[acyl-carrier-protein] synthase III C-terminal domain-containing protein, partial [Gammaproteobacteria bacterium]